MVILHTETCYSLYLTLFLNIIYIHRSQQLHSFSQRRFAHQCRRQRRRKDVSRKPSLSKCLVSTCGTHPLHVSSRPLHRHICVCWFWDHAVFVALPNNPGEKINEAAKNTAAEKVSGCHSQ